MLRHGARLLAQQARGFAAEAALAEEGVFSRFGSPFAQQLNLAPALAQLPETQVRWGRVLTLPPAARRLPGQGGAAAAAGRLWPARLTPAAAPRCR